MNQKAERWEKYSSQALPQNLKRMRVLAKKEGRQLQHVVNEAMEEYIEKREGSNSRKHVMAHFNASVEKNRRLGELLAK